MVITYYALRLTFKRSLIEALESGDAIRIVTPGAAFPMTKAQFDEVFANVAWSTAYRVRGEYNYADIPKKALPFLVEVSL